MLLATRCPFCETVFRIQPAQLATRRGLVRCGHCQEAFDASGSLYEMPEGGDFGLAVPVAADIAASLTTPHGTQAAAHLAQLADPAPAEPVDAVEPVEAPPQEAQPAPAAAPEPAAPEPAAAATRPNFSNPSWDPWAPLPDSHIDPSLQYDAGHLPQPSLAAAATRPRHPTDMRVIRDDEPTLASTPATGADEPAPAGHWTPVEPELVPPEPVAPATLQPTRSEPGLSSHETQRTPIADAEPGFRSASSATAIAAAGAAAPAFTALEPNDGAEPFALTREAPARAKRRTGWRVLGALITLLLIVLLALQLAWWQRETVMVYWPASQPLYQQACAQLGCHVSPPRDIDGLQVQPSDLRQVDDPHHLELKVPLRNRFQVALAYPAIELTLLDRQNNVVLRRVLWPQDYAPPGTPIDAGIAAHTTQTMIVRLDTGNVIASNFRIEIFYP
ncbi:zinc-ribbon and DUF3426 domain-containing protein [Paraburkholderia sp. J67]|uniref:zinc-ribbon and DUF3426 domain-containing protein n=1 Tax=Paraburkholderia sp. J67 TaxID=2805435 RepID=UPI002ABDACA9|nr:zinc-ribbon and DUF3426 domain-containing protein [Paraburkholderia sp. J67]